MEDDCEAYIDSEEDEVFFGCINEREIQYFQKEKLGGRDETGTKNIDIKKVIKDKEIVKFKEMSEEVIAPLDVSEESNFRSCNTSVEMDHNYSIHIKEKIDKSILETPRSIVKADEDGGFLKVLSEIALVKAEVENNEKAAESEDENKKNKVPCIPEIKITEATPDKKEVSPCQSLEHHLRRFQIIYNSPPMNNMEKKCSKKNIQLIHNEYNEYHDIQEEKKEICTQEAQNLVKNTDNIHNKEDSLPSNNSKDSNISIKSLDKKLNEPNAQYSNIFETNPNLLDKKKEENNYINNEIEDFNKLLLIAKQNYVNDEKSFHTMRNEEESKQLQLEQPKITSESCMGANATFQDSQKHFNDFQKEEFRNKKQIIHVSNSNIDNLKTSEAEFKSIEYSTGNVLDEISNLRKFRESSTLCKQIRFSQEVRKVVEIFKKSAEDTFNSTIPEIEVNNIEDSFFSIEPISLLANDFEKADPITGSKLISPCRKNNNNKLTKQFNTVEKMNFKKNSALPRNKIVPLKSFSEKKVQPVSQIKINKCVKKLPISEKKLATNKLNMKENLHFKNTDFTSKIPVYGRKMVKTSNLSKNIGATTGTPLKFPTEKIYKNQKFKHVTSPVNAYIHNKPSYKPIETRVKEVATENGSVKKNKPIQELPYPFMNGQNVNLHQKKKQFNSRQLLGSTQKPIGLGIPKVLKQDDFLSEG